MKVIFQLNIHRDLGSCDGGTEAEYSIWSKDTGWLAVLVIRPDHLVGLITVCIHDCM